MKYRVSRDFALSWNFCFHIMSKPCFSLDIIANVLLLTAIKFIYDICVYAKLHHQNYDLLVNFQRLIFPVVICMF